MNINKSFVEEKENEILKKLKHSNQDYESYLKAASFLHFSERYESAIKVLDIGLQHHPSNEKLIRAKFSFLCSSYNLLEAFLYAKQMQLIFNNDSDSIITQACDLITINLSLSPPEFLDQRQIVRLSDELQMFHEEKHTNLQEFITNLFGYYHLPLIGLGIAHVLANDGNDYAQTLLGTCYLKGRYINQDIDLGMHYLNLAKENDNEVAINRLNLFYSTTS